MKSKFLFFIIIVLLALALTACTRSIVTNPEQPTATTSQPGVPSDQEGESITLPSPGPVELLPQVTSPVTSTVPSEPAEPVLCAYPAGWISYTIQPGDTLETISAQFAVPAEDLFLANCLYAGGVLEPGKTILVPPPAQVSELPSTGQPTEATPATPSGETAPSGEATAPGEAAPSTEATTTTQAKKEKCKTNYIVRSGDWVYKIGRRCNISPYAIIAANNLRYPYWLRPGDHLYLPPNAPPFPKH